MQKGNDQISSINEDEQEMELKDVRKAYFYCVIMCISTAYSGYSITLISSTSITELKRYYQIDTAVQTTLSLLNGMLPVGAMVGCLVLPCFLSIMNKKHSHYILLGVSIIECGLSVIPSFQSLLISRFILGVLNAFYTSISAAYIKQTFPFYLRKPFGAIYSCGRIVGILICYLIAELSHYPDNDLEHILVFWGPAFLAFIQAVLIYFFIPQSPIDMINSYNEIQLNQSLAKLYRIELIPYVINRLKRQVEQTNRLTKTQNRIKLTNKKNLLSFHLALLRHFCGATFIVIYARQVMIDLKSDFADDAPVIINSIQLAAGFAGIFLVTRLRRRLMVIFCTMALAVIVLIIGIADLLEQSLFCLISMTIFMIPCGACLTSVIWSYPSQLASKSQGKYASFLSWTGTAIVTLVPPYILKSMPNNAAYPIFFFFALYLIISFIINYFVLVEVEDLKSQIFELKNKSLISS